MMHRCIIWHEVSETLLFYISFSSDDSLRQEYPFTLKLVQKDGCWCSRCPWHRFCRGCAMPCTTQNFKFGSSYLAIDWDQTALHLRYHTAQERVRYGYFVYRYLSTYCIRSLIQAYKSDSSVAASVRAASEPITLHKCLEAFTRQEELGPDEKYYCSSCKTHQLASKKLQIWKLPPILVSLVYSSFLAYIMYLR